MVTQHSHRNLLFLQLHKKKNIYFKTSLCVTLRLSTAILLRKMSLFWAIMIFVKQRKNSLHQNSLIPQIKESSCLEIVSTTAVVLLKSRACTFYVITLSPEQEHKWHIMLYTVRLKFGVRKKSVNAIFQYKFLFFKSRGTKIILKIILEKFEF